MSLPDQAKLVYRPTIADQDDWASLPISASSQEFGGRWLADGKQLVMMVPSAIVPEATNAVINPAHPGYRSVKLTVVRDFLV
jgi:RES domain-containing protein